jgi:cytochrome P450
MEIDGFPPDMTVADTELWHDGPPHGLFDKLRSQCPVHWSPNVVGRPLESGFWSITRAEDLQTVSRDWQTYSSQREGSTDIGESDIPEALREMFHQSMIDSDPPRHLRLKKLFVGGFTLAKIAEHEPWIRDIVVGVLGRLDGRDTADLVADVSTPVVSRVIHRLMGIPEEDDEMWAHDMARYVARDDRDLNPGGLEEWLEEFIPRVEANCHRLIEERRADPGDDLISTLVQAEVEGERLNDDELSAGIQLFFAAGNDSTKATYVSAMKALMEHPEQRELVLEDMSLVPSVVEEALRMYPAFSSMRRTATRDVQLGGQDIKEGDKVILWYPAGNRDPERYEDPHRFDVTRNPDHQAFGAGGRHFCLGNALARLELRVMIEETLNRYPAMEIIGEAPFIESFFANQVKTLPVRLGPSAR